jgi:CubicO group peptidase (beta-lactamase class C family)
LYYISIYKIIRLKNLFRLALALLSLSACGSSPQEKHSTDSLPSINYKSPPKRNIEAGDSTRLHNSISAFYDSVLAARGFNGSFLVAKGGHILFEKYNGRFKLPSGEALNDHSAFNLASVSKTFTAMATLYLMEAGKLKLDDSISKYLPGFPYEAITIKHLLSHRSGLPNYVHFMDQFHPDPKSYITNKDVLDTLIAHKAVLPLSTPPGTHFSYCNTNYALLALIIEKVSGRSFPDFMRTYFFTPLQMDDTYVCTAADIPRSMPSYDWKGALMAFNYLDAVYGDKNMYSTVRDLLKWDEALKSGQFFKKETLAAAYAGYSFEKDGIRNYGLGWRMFNWPNGKKLLYHNGWWHGSNTAFIRLLDEDAVIIALGNKFNRGIYGVNRLSVLFGDYGLKMEEEGEPTDSLQQRKTADTLKAKTGKKKIPPPKKSSRKR